MQVRHLDDPGPVCEQMIQIMCDMVCAGLVHCDFNEFNVIISDNDQLTAIDFPQMVSVSHKNAQSLFERDLKCIVRFFEKKMGYYMASDTLPAWDDLLQQVAQHDPVDVALHASGFNHDDSGTVSVFHGRVSNGPECNSQIASMKDPKRQPSDDDHCCSRPLEDGDSAYHSQRSHGSDPDVHQDHGLDVNRSNWNGLPHAGGESCADDCSELSGTCRAGRDEYRSAQQDLGQVSHPVRFHLFDRLLKFST